MLGSILKDLIRTRNVGTAAEGGRHRVLNVGGSSNAIAIPGYFDGWEHLLLDIDPRGNADIVCDARMLGTLPATQFDAVYCSHNLEHYHPHDGAKVLQGFLHVLKPDGFADVRVPDMKAVFEDMIRRGMDIDDVLYESPAGPITINDVIYGFGRKIAESGQDFYAHRNGFTHRSLVVALRQAGFAPVFTGQQPYEISALAFKQEPTAEQRALFGLPPPANPSNTESRAKP
jgi:SAM-dependent methyltransferase